MHMTYPLRANEGLGRFQRLTLGEEVAQSVRMILTTRPGERPLRPKFGAGLDRFAFEGLGLTTQNLIRREVVAALGRWEPRALEPEVTFQRLPQEGRLMVNVSYRLPGTGERGRTEVELRG